MTLTSKIWENIICVLIKDFFYLLFFVVFNDGPRKGRSTYIKQIHSHVISQSNNTLPCGKKLAHYNVLLNKRLHVMVNSFHVNPSPAKESVNFQKEKVALSRKSLIISTFYIRWTNFLPFFLPTCLKAFPHLHSKSPRYINGWRSNA